tara:strand:- start:274 stop:588 length:315 start_codon:yes stop_codon:yes gene_type:complete
MKCFQQSVKNTSISYTYEIEKYEPLDNIWEKTIYRYPTYEEALDFYNNNALFPNLTEERKKNGNFEVFRIIETKTMSKPVLTNNELLKTVKNIIKRMRDEGRLN